MTTITQTKTVPAKVGTVLTEHEYDTLNKMLKSKDPADHTMAQAILNQCDIPKSIYWIWKLAKQGNSTRMVYLRTKASRDFSSFSMLFSISNRKATSFALLLVEKKWLTEEMYQRLKPEILDELAARNKEMNFYEIYIDIKETYSQFDPESALTHLKTTKV